MPQLVITLSLPEDEATMRAHQAVKDVVAELQQTSNSNRPFASAHEGFAILKEEVDELWEEIKVNEGRRDLDKVVAEARQVAAMALRIMIDCGPDA